MISKTVLIQLLVYSQYLDKFSELQAIVYDHSSQIIGIAESWFSSNVVDAELHIQSYDSFIMIASLVWVVLYL